MEDPEQIRQLLEKINRMTVENCGGHYTVNMLKKAKKASKKEKQRLAKERMDEEQQRKNNLKAEVKREMNLTGQSVKHATCLLQ